MSEICFGLYLGVMGLCEYESKRQVDFFRPKGALARCIERVTAASKVVN